MSWNSHPSGKFYCSFQNSLSFYIIIWLFLLDKDIPKHNCVWYHTYQNQGYYKEDVLENHLSKQYISEQCMCLKKYFLFFFWGGGTGIVIYKAFPNAKLKTFINFQGKKKNVETDELEYTCVYWKHVTALQWLWNTHLFGRGHSKKVGSFQVHNSTECIKATHWLIVYRQH